MPDNEKQYDETTKMILDKMKSYEEDNKQLRDELKKVIAFNRQLLNTNHSEPSVDKEKEHDELFAKLKGGLKNGR